MSDSQALLARLNYRFDDPSLLTMALTHRSWGRPNNERLEYLGDSVLGLFVAEQLYRRYPDMSEGNLTRLRAQLVRRETLTELARALEIECHLIVGRGELKSGGYRRDSVLGNALEALIGAIYMDGGIDAAFAVLQVVFADKLDEADPGDLRDPKTRLQEYLQEKALPLPHYLLVEQDGKAHNPTFTVSCRIEQPQFECVVSGRTRKLAEQAAAARMLSRLVAGDV